MDKSVRTINTFRGNSTSYSWIYRIMKNVYIDYHLTPTCKRVFSCLYYVHEMPIKAIATHLERSEGTIKTHLRNARLQLRERRTPYLKNQHISWLA